MFKLRLLFALVGLGAAMCFMGYSEWNLAAKVKADPDVVPCAVFESRGPLDNAHLRLTAFQSTEDMYCAYEEQEYGSGYSIVLVPVFPLNRPNDPKNEDLRVILRFYNVQDDADLVQRVDEHVATGISESMGSSLHHEFRSILKDGYPGIQLDKCHVVNVDQRLPSRSRAMGMMAFGATAIFAFVGILGWSFSGDNSRSSVTNTASPDYMAKRMPTELDPAKFQQSSKASDSGVSLASSPADAEMNSYQREFEERYGISSEKAGQSATSS